MLLGKNVYMLYLDVWICYNLYLTRAHKKHRFLVQFFVLSVVRKNTQDQNRYFFCWNYIALNYIWYMADLRNATKPSDLILISFRYMEIVHFSRNYMKENKTHNNFLLCMPKHFLNIFEAAGLAIFCSKSSYTLIFHQREKMCDHAITLLEAWRFMSLMVFGLIFTCLHLYIYELWTMKSSVHNQLQNGRDELF